MSVRREPWRRELDVALGAVRDAAVLARDIQEQISQAALVKADQSPVTVADFAVQAVIACRLAAEFPADALVAEEDAALLCAPRADRMLGEVIDRVRRVVPEITRHDVLKAIDRGAGTPTDRFWALDPVDGTKGFIRGGQYVVALALVIRGRVEVGVLGCPRLSLIPDAEADPAASSDMGSISYAVRGGGAFGAALRGADFVSLRVSVVRNPRRARVLRSYDHRHIDLDGFNRIVKMLGLEVPPILMDSQAKHAVLASGQADLLLRLPAFAGFHDKIWDHAAGSLIVEEAGGHVTDLHGKELDFSAGRLLALNAGVVASNGHLHRAALEAIEQCGLVPR